MQEVPPDAQAFREELERVLSSAALRNADSLRRLLSYVAEAYLAGKSREVKEYTIGRDVMGKPEDYDPRVDASVRVQAGKLRQRLEQYYTSEAPLSAWQIRVPKGHFEIEFKQQAQIEPVAPPPPARPVLWQSAAAILTVACLGLSLWIVTLKTQTPPGLARHEWTEEMNQFWGPFVQASKPLTFVLGSPLFVRFHDSYFRHPLVNDWASAERDLPLEEMRRLLKNPTPASETHRWAPFGEAVAAFRLASVLAQRKQDMIIKRSSVLSWEDMRASNLVFLGPRKFNPQIQDLPINQDFIIDRGAVHNLRIRPGEKAAYSKPTPADTEDIPEDYSVITRMRGIEGWGEVLVLASSSTEGTWAAADYVSDPAHLRELTRRLSLDTGRVPDCYQVLLRSRFREQVPIQTEYVLHHVVTPRTANAPRTR
ncbi:MAG: hypothetical protein C0504_08530 [Candidatus Solibacter sp.]|nr:hypothetical protein [Candidatus Solibacter sp.]